VAPSGFLIQRTQQKPEGGAPDRKSLELLAPIITVVGRQKGAFVGSNLPEADFRTALARASAPALGAYRFYTGPGPETEIANPGHHDQASA
jgi:hypothetical protein